MKHTFTLIIEKGTETGLYVAHVPGVAGAHAQGATPVEARDNPIRVMKELPGRGGTKPKE